MRSLKIQILALDLGTHCGFAHTSGVSGVWDFSLKADESDGSRLFRFRSQLSSFLKNYKVSLIVFEAVRNLQFGHPVRVSMEFQGVLKEWCVDKKIEYRGYSPTTIKRFATGRGRANKEEILIATKTKWPDLQIIDDNHADALWLLELAKSEYVS